MGKQQRKRSSDDLQEKAVIKRQPSERTLVATRIENSLHLGNASPVVEDQVLSLSPREAPDDSLFFDGISTVFEDSPIKKFKPDIERERCPKPEIDCLSEDIENEHVSFNQAVVDDVPKTQTTDFEQKGEDEPDGPGIFPTCFPCTVLDEVDGNVGTRKPLFIKESAVSYITQDPDRFPQIYLNVSGDRITMGSYTDERAQFVLDFYHVFGEKHIGQLCVIRHDPNETTKQIYDAVQNSMKTMKKYVLPDQALMLDKISRNDGTFVFESVHLRGHYPIYQRSSNTLKLSQYHCLKDVTNEGSFKVIAV